MQPFEQATAQQRAYEELSEIFLSGISANSIPFLRTVGLEHQLDSDSQDEEELAAAHYDLFGLNVFPYASIFLHGDMMIGTAVTNSIQNFYHEVGFTDYASDMADHIGNLFGLLGYLSAAEADAFEDHKVAEARRMQHLQLRFLNDYLLPWLPALTKAVQQQGSSLYGSLLELSLDFVTAQYNQLQENSVGDAPAFRLPRSPNLLDNEKTGLRDIAEYLLIPVYAGFYLSRDDVRRLGSEHDLPHGFGKRKQILTNLLRTAVDYDVLEDVIFSLRRICTDWQSYYQALEPVLEPFAVIWQKRLIHTHKILDTIAQYTRTISKD
jgi:TorA maturation chaperone TorD